MGWGLTRCERLVEAAAAYEEGKAMVPAAIIDKPSMLNEAEFAEVTEHALLGARALEPFLTIEQLGWVLHHHERWDGLGYPDGLMGDDIPLGARILSVADAWDAMTSTRCYRSALGPGAAMAECWRCAGSQFDPEVVKALTRVRPLPAPTLSRAR
jgi:HD-GYP domain-containing protein (c-di-GMP phosphodiesterase class II)